MKLLIPLFMASAVYFVSARADVATDAEVVDVACSQEARIAHCGPDAVGTGLLRCLRAYGFSQLSSGCKAAIDRFEIDETRPVYINPVVVVRPVYASPGPGYLWRLHPRYGWGWYHPRFGWHQGWR